MDSIEQTLAQRGKVHGEFSDNGYVMQALKNTLRQQQGWHRLSPEKREALDMICHKMGRILCGDPNFSDHWHDIAGYATLVEKEILKNGVGPYSAEHKS